MVNYDFVLHETPLLSFLLILTQPILHVRLYLLRQRSHVPLRMESRYVQLIEKSNHYTRFFVQIQRINAELNHVISNVPTKITRLDLTKLATTESYYGNLKSLHRYALVNAAIAGAKDRKKLELK